MKIWKSTGTRITGSYTTACASMENKSRVLFKTFKWRSSTWLDLDLRDLIKVKIPFYNTSIHTSKCVVIWLFNQCFNQVSSHSSLILIHKIIHDSNNQVQSKSLSHFIPQIIKILFYKSIFLKIFIWYNIYSCNFKITYNEYAGQWDAKITRLCPT